MDSKGLASEGLCFMVWMKIMGSAESLTSLRALAVVVVVVKT